MDTDRKLEVLYKIANLLRNGHKSPVQYGVNAMKLLSRLREIDEDEYDRLVKPAIPDCEYEY